MKTPIECLPSTPDEVLNDLCERLNWCAGDSNWVEVATATAELDGHGYVVFARRYNITTDGKLAVKAVVHQTHTVDQRRLYVGALGRHHPEANPYAKTPLGDTFPESSLLAVLGTCVVLNPESPAK